MRILLQYLLPLLLPAAIYMAWLSLRARGRRFPAIEEGPWFWLLVGGFVLAAISVMSIAFVGGFEPGRDYVAPRYEDGRIVPGQPR